MLKINLSNRTILRHCIVVLFFATGSLSLFANNNKIDSLLHLANSTTIVTEKFNANYELGKLLYSQNADSALMYTQFATKIAETNSLFPQLAKSYIQLGQLYKSKQLSDSSLFYYQEAYNLAEEIEDYDLQLESLNKIGGYYYSKRKYTEAYDTFNKALEITENASDPKLKVTLLNNLALWHKTNNKSSKALEYYKEALSLSEENNYLKGVGLISSNMGLLYESMDKTDEALKYLKQSLAIRQKLNNKKGESYVHTNLGLVYENLHEYDKALEQYRRSLQLKNELNIKKSVDILYNNIAIIFKKQDLPDSAFYYANKALQLRIANNNKMGEARTRTVLGQTYLLVGNTTKAEQELTLALQLAQDYKNLSVLQNIHSSLYNLYMENKAYDKAVDHLLKANKFKDRIFNIEKEKSIATIEAKYDLLNSETENLRLSHEVDLNKAQLRRYITIGLALTIALLAIAVLLFVVARSRKKLAEKNKRIEQQASQLQHTNSKLESLSKFQESMTNMLVHDLKTPLNVIVNYQNMKNMESYDQLIQQSGYSMQTLIHNLLDVYKYKDSTLKLNKENIQLGYIIKRAFEEVSFLAKAKNLKYKLEFDIDFMINIDYEIIKRVFVNLLTNAIKYTPTEETITLKIHLLNPDELSIQIHNPGSVIPKEKQELIFEYFKQAEDDIPERIKSTGLGLNFCRMAIEAHNGHIGVKSEEGMGTTFWFTLPNVIKETQLSFPNIEETRNWFN